MKHLNIIQLLLAMAGCKNGHKSELPTKDEETSRDEISTLDQEHPGKTILENECYVCHDPKATRTNMIAPPMVVIKMHYIDSSTSKKEFSDALINWVNDPQESTKMPGAHKKFGSMPYMPHPEETIRLVAEYLYDNEIERPEWLNPELEARYRKDIANGTGIFQGWDLPLFHTTYSEKGLGYAKSTQAALGKNLVRAIMHDGPAGAIKFCNLKAIGLTDSMSVMNNAVIRRVSDRPRNSNNLATEAELGYINYYKKLISSGVELEAMVKITNEEVHFYYPILTTAMCLQCHGKPNEQITPETLASIKNLYPDDKAIGYDDNEVRGLWAIDFETEK